MPSSTPNSARKTSNPRRKRTRLFCFAVRLSICLACHPHRKKFGFPRRQFADAFEKVIDRLLASPQYGERWARHWLDLARYAESEGFKADETRPNAWRYRDYVIRSFNADKPYDRFIREQIAGDELWPDDPEALIATAF